MISSHKRLVAGTSFLLLIFSVLASLFFASHSAHATSAAPSRTVYADYLIRLAGASPDPLTLTEAPGSVRYNSGSGDFPSGIQEIECLTGPHATDIFPRAKAGTVVRGPLLACEVTSDTGRFPGNSNPGSVAAHLRVHGFQVSVANH